MGEIESLRGKSIEVVSRHPSGDGKHFVANFSFFTHVESAHGRRNFPERLAVIVFERIIAKMKTLIAT